MRAIMWKSSCRDHRNTMPEPQIIISGNIFCLNLALTRLTSTDTTNITITRVWARQHVWNQGSDEEVEGDGGLTLSAALDHHLRDLVLKWDDFWQRGRQVAAAAEPGGDVVLRIRSRIAIRKHPQTSSLIDDRIWRVTFQSHQTFAIHQCTRSSTQTRVIYLHLCPVNYWSFLIYCKHIWLDLYRALRTFGFDFMQFLTWKTGQENWKKEKKKDSNLWWHANIPLRAASLTMNLGLALCTHTAFAWSSTFKWVFPFFFFIDSAITSKAENGPCSQENNSENCCKHIFHHLESVSKETSVTHLSTHVHRGV